MGRPSCTAAAIARRKDFPGCRETPCAVQEPLTLVLTDKFAPHCGGTALYWTQVVLDWPRDAFQVVTRDLPGGRDFDRKNSLPVVRIPFLDIPKVRMPLLWTRMFLRAIWVLVRRQVNAVHCTQLVESGIYGPLLARIFNVPFLLTFHGEELNQYLRVHWLAPHLLRAIRGASGIVVNSQFTRRIVEEKTGYDGPIVVANPGVDLARFTPNDREAARRRLELPPGPMLLTVSRLVPRKGHDLVIRCLPELLRGHPDLYYVVVGAGRERGRLERLTAETGVTERVLFRGLVPDEELPDYYRAADAFVHPNTELASGDIEGFGIVFLEANACGCPVIGGRSGGSVEAVSHGRSGLLVKPGSREEFLQAVGKILGERPISPESCREWAAGFSWKESSLKIWDLTRSVVRAR